VQRDDGRWNLDEWQFRSGGGTTVMAEAKAAARFVNDLQLQNARTVRYSVAIVSASTI
jgi:hypothetical protein